VLIPVADPRQTQGVPNHEFNGERQQPTEPGLPLDELLAAAAAPTQYRELVRFARLRLKRLAAAPENQRPLAGLDPEDLVAEAVLQVSLGELDSKLGRRLAHHNRASTAAFVLCLKGIIRSNLSNCLRRTEAQHEHLPLGEELETPGSAEPADPAELNAQLAHRDLQRVVFERLYRAVGAKPALLPAIQDWEPNFLNSSRIGDRAGDSNLSHRLRGLVRAILDDLARDLGPSNPGGREMLL
jgi:hypothetical protein